MAASSSPRGWRGRSGALQGLARRSAVHQPTQRERWPTPPEHRQISPLSQSTPCLTRGRTACEALKGPTPPHAPLLTAPASPGVLRGEAAILPPLSGRPRGAAPLIAIFSSELHLPETAEIARIPESDGGLFVANETMSNRDLLTCNECYFRQEGLCAIPGNTVCPTFRASVTGRLEPQPPRLALVGSPPTPVAASRPAANTA